VAARWLTANLKDEYDAMLRLQVLEGVAGVPVDSWWQEGRRGVGAAADRLGSADIDPAWLSRKNSGMLAIIERTLAATLRGFGVPYEPMDIINNALMGLKIDSSREGRTGRPAYEAGVDLRARVLAGVETPGMAAKGTVGTYLSRKVSNEAKRFREAPLPEGVEGEAVELPDRSKGEPPADFLAKVIFRDKGSPLSENIRGLMRKVWSGLKGQANELMLDWLDEAEKGHVLESGELAARHGKGKQYLSQGPWKKAWAAFFNAFWSDSALLNQIELYLQEQGFDVSIEKPSPSAMGNLSKYDPLNLIFKKKPKRARQLQANRRTLERIVTRWLSDGDVVSQVVRQTEESPDHPAC